MGASSRVLQSGLAGAVFMLCTTAVFACGTERWAVKVAADIDAALIDLENVALLPIEDLGKMPAPAHPNRRSTTRWPNEGHLYAIAGKLTFLKAEADGDYHLVIDDGAGHTVIAEAPDPKCAAKSRLIEPIQAVRTAIESAVLSVRKAPLHPNVAVAAIGVAFFDVLHGQFGHAPNGIELHPLVRFEVEKTE